MPANPFLVHAARLRRVPGNRWHEIRRGPVDPDGILVPPTPADSAVPGGAEAVCDVILASFSGGIMVTGTVRAPWQGTCRRCALPVGGELVIPVRERYVDLDTLTAQVRAGEPEDDEAYPMVDDELDLGPLVRDAVVLELPLAPLCRDDCRGLCPTCGVDRNQDECHCVAPRDPRWANLDVLRSAQ